MFVITNKTTTSIALDSEIYRRTLQPYGVLNIENRDFIGNYNLCIFLSTLVTRGKVTVTRNSNTVSSSDLLSYAQGSDMLKTEYDSDDDTVVDETGSSGGSLTTTFTETEIDLIDDTDFTITEDTLLTTLGQSAGLLLTPSTATGQVTVQLFQDSARTEKIFEHIVDLTDSSTYFSSDVFSFENETAGTIYGTLLCSGIPASQTTDISLYCNSMQPTGEVVTPDEPYGNGIENDGSGYPQVKLATSSGLGFSSGGLQINPDLTASSYPSTNADGAILVGVVDNSTDEDVECKKRFSSSGLIPLGSPGAPSAGTYSTGAEVLDSNNIKYRCTSGGSPGTWDLVDVVTAQTSVENSSTLGDGDSELLQLSVNGNTGNCIWLRIWGKTATGSADIQIPFRARIYQTTSQNGRELVWQDFGLIRQTSLTAELPVSQGYLEVNTNDILDNGEGVVVYEDNTRFEFSRISGRPAGQMTMEEALLDDSSWASGSLVLVVNEFYNVPWINTDGSPANQNKILLEVRHDGLSTDSDIVIYAEAYAQSRGMLI